MLIVTAAYGLADHFEQSVELTYLPKSSDSHRSSQQSMGDRSVEYSSREVSPPALLVQQVIRAHQIFLLHHGSSLTDIWSRVSREKFCGFLSNFWNSFLQRWDVMLHGNPSVDIYNGLRISAGGELGIGVGEEDWGSGEREVLEGFIERTDGLVDLIVSRFERPSEKTKTDVGPDTSVVVPSSLGGRRTSSEGVIFSGIGALARSSIRTISAWVESLVVSGSDAYGVRDNPTSNPRRKYARNEDVHNDGIRPNRKNAPSSRAAGVSRELYDRPGIPAPIVRPRTDIGGNSNLPLVASKTTAEEFHGQTPAALGGSAVGAEMMKYLTLGVYGSSWGLPSGRPTAQRASSLIHEGDSRHLGKTGHLNKQDAIDGYFLIGLLGSLEEELEIDDEASDTIGGSKNISKSGNRTLVRYVHVERVDKATYSQSKFLADTRIKAEQVYHDRLRVIVYVQEPFIFTFLFEPQTDSLAKSSFYRSLHHQLGPLRRPLLKSTDPARTTQRLWDASSTKSTAPMRNLEPIRDLVYDPGRLTVHTTILDIPEPNLGPTDVPASWTRVEALSVHSQILNTYVSTRRHRSELERTCKTSRGWWVVWMRLPHSPASSSQDGDHYREAILIRKSSDYVAPKPRNTSSGLGFGWGGGESAGNGWGPARLAEGIGIDARQYIDGILSFSR